MPVIFVNTDNSDPANKLYRGAKAGKHAAAAEAIMQKVVRKIVDKAGDFTTTRPDKPKGYSIWLEVSKVEVAGRQTKCSLSGSIVRYPKSVTYKGEKGDYLVNTSMIGNARADGPPEGALLDCIEAIAEDLVAKSVPVMRADISKW